MRSSMQILLLKWICIIVLTVTSYKVGHSKGKASIPIGYRRKEFQLHSFQKPDVVDVDLGDRTYPIYIGQNLLQSVDKYQLHVTSKKALIVTNTLVGPLYASSVKESLEKAGVAEVHIVTLPDGEEYKNMDVLMKIIDAAMEAKLDRKSTMIALGGGVIGDMCGFAASIYQRGIKFVQVPTTLMAMVDSAVGGKTAVNHPRGKNMIGAFYQPETVIIDTDTLSSLPDRELHSGIAEVIKYGLIMDRPLFEWLESNIQLVLDRDPAALTEIIRRSCENKAVVVAADEKEGGVRAKLNLGHTFGHAIEAGLGYGAWLHGEAVATGMLMAADMSHRMGLVDSSVLSRTHSLLQLAGLPVAFQGDGNIDAKEQYKLGPDSYQDKVNSLDTEKFLELMSVDKKVADGKLSLILLEGPLGGSVITNKFDSKTLKETVANYCTAE